MYHAGFTSELPNSLDSVYKFLMDGGVFMFCLMLLSFLSVTVILMKLIALRERRVVPHKVQETCGYTGGVQHPVVWQATHPTGACPGRNHRQEYHGT